MRIAEKRQLRRERKQKRREAKHRYANPTLDDLRHELRQSYAIASYYEGVMARAVREGWPMVRGW